MFILFILLLCIASAFFSVLSIKLISPFTLLLMLALCAKRTGTCSEIQLNSLLCAKKKEKKKNLLFIAFLYLQDSHSLGVQVSERHAPLVTPVTKCKALVTGFHFIPNCQRGLCGCKAQSGMCVRFTVLFTFTYCSIVPCLMSVPHWTLFREQTILFCMRRKVCYLVWTACLILLFLFFYKKKVIYVTYICYL